MAGLLVYIPGSTSADCEAELRRVGLEDLLDRNVAPIPTPIAKGPDGGSGRLITFDMGPAYEDTPRVVDLSAQEWRAAPPDPERTECAAGRYWLGYVKNARPTPEELRRPEVIDGEPVRLCDGNLWVIPIEDYLPRRLTIDGITGKETRQVTDRHREFSNFANAIYELFLSDGFLSAVKKDVVVEIPRGLTFAGLALSKNYRVNRDVVDLLELVEDYEAFEIAKVACGIAPALRIFADQKKTDRSLINGNSMPASIRGASNGPSMFRPSSM